MNRLCILLTILCMLPALLFAKSCDSYWQVFLSKHQEKPKYSEFLKFWQNEVGDDCKKTAGYYYYYADSFKVDIDADKAISVAKYDLKKFHGSNYDPLLKAIIADATTYKDYKKNSSFHKAEKLYLQIIKDYPKNSEVYARYAGSCLFLKQYSKAEKFARLSNQIKPNDLALTILVQTSFYYKKYNEVIEYANKAAKFDKYIYANQNVMTAVALSYANLGKFKTAENVMNILIAKNPRVVDDENFKYAEKYLNYLYTKSKEKEESKGEIKHAK